MSKKGRIPLRLDIVGLIPDKFIECQRNVQSFVESRSKGTVSESRPDQASSGGDELYFKIARIALDFQRAYGSAVQIRTFRRSTNKILEKILGTRDSGKAGIPVFYVNGVRIFKGVPNSFSELDEAIENAFGRSR
ncbi:MAG: hypothetical protein JRN20_01155 [Nitrososphaerota archaeon]|nr:hypothetical protein [Nitrososphaerota archaeon]MDG6922197.1 hypothetical protein [Nitrososphaerota archaeon]